MEKFITILKNSLSVDTFVKLTLSKTRYRSDLQNVYVRMIELKDEANLSFTYHYETKDEVQNFSISEGVERIQLHLLEDFKNANLLLIDKNIALEISKKGKTRIMEKSTANEKPERIHNKEKSRFVEADRPYLHHLGVTSKEGKVLKNWQSKYKQIDKYIEIIDGLLRQTTLPRTINIVDMGSGKGYLTFALYDYLVNVLKLNVTLTGIELREHLVDFCNDIAKQSNFENLNFIAQDINDYPAEKIDILIALHACDIATDIALAKGMLSEAALIVAAPCCHKQVRKQMSKNNPLQSVLKHGILEERQAEMITDGIRALMLEGNGYAAKVFEFVSSEHTNKNLMIVGTRTAKRELSAFEQIADIKKQFGIEEHYLEKLMEA
jgi:16S rRNA G527 N7-methylase RsmG